MGCVKVIIICQNDLSSFVLLKLVVRYTRDANLSTTGILKRKVSVISNSFNSFLAAIFYAKYDLESDQVDI